jgi:hypothetical protein
MGYADPEMGIGDGYVTNRMGTNLQGATTTLKAPPIHCGSAGG